MSVDMESHRESVDRVGYPDRLSRYQDYLGIKIQTGIKLL